MKKSTQFHLLNPTISMNHTKHSWFSFSAYLFLLVFLILCLALFKNNDHSFIFRNSISFPVTKNVSETTKNDSCFGRYIYIHDLPNKFNADIIKNCSHLITWHGDSCPAISNMGLGSRVLNSRGMLQDRNWYLTNQFMLGLIFHNKMKQYKCLTKNSSQASAIYVPFYAGLDIGRYLKGFNTIIRDKLPTDIIKWLVEKPEWKFMNGKDHFLVAGRVSWDFRRQGDNSSYWGNKLFTTPEAKNITFLIIESCPWCSPKDIAIPYPTFFHPSNDGDVYDWQEKVRREKRQYLYTFVGGPRPTIRDSIRNEIVNQCVKSNESCKWIDCRKNGINCEDPIQVIGAFQSSNFCLQPPGDSATRRSAFDSILAGCIPVFFNPDSAYTQYMWHLPKNYSKYSVYIPESDMRNGTANIEEILRRISEEEVKNMREEIVRLIPKIMYSNPMGKLERIEDAFDIAIKGVLAKIEKNRKEMKEDLQERSLYNSSVV